MASSPAELAILSLLPGRLRVHLPSWTAEKADQIETRLGQMKGVRSVEAGRLTGNVLVRFDPHTIGEKGLIEKLQETWEELLAQRRPDWDVAPASRILLRVGVRGLLGHAVVDSLWFAAGFAGKSFGLPLAALGPLHVLMDIAVWGFALGQARASSVVSPNGRLAKSEG